jgi:hypothetical protein
MQGSTDAASRLANLVHFEGVASVNQTPTLHAHPRALRSVLLLTVVEARGRERTPALGVVVDPRDAALLDREDVVDPVVDFDLEHADAARVKDRVALGADQLERVDLARLVALPREHANDLVGPAADPFLLQALPDDIRVERCKQCLAVVAAQRVEPRNSMLSRFITSPSLPNGLNS